MSATLAACARLLSGLKQAARALPVIAFLAAPGVKAQGVGESYGLAPYWDWKTLETEHFRVTFPAELSATATKSAQYLEEAHSILSPRLYWTPHYRTQVVVVDNTDLSNGLTSPIGRFGMIFMVSPPDSWFSTYYYDDWLRLLAIHEYTHFLNMGATTGIWNGLRYVFGDILLPNSIWPSWMLEGLAVYMETRYTRSGRGRSPYYEMVLRTAVDNDVLNDPKFVTLDAVNGPNPRYPLGETAYLFGYQMMNQVARTPLNGKTADQRAQLLDNEDSLGVMSQRSSDRVPFLINDNLENISGKDWYAHWDDWTAQTRARMKAQLEKIRSQPVTQVEWVTQGGQNTLGSTISPDGKWIAYTQDSADERMGLRLRNLDTGLDRWIEEKTLGATLSFTPDSQALFYSSIRRHKQYYLFSDLAVYDLKDGRTHWLTDGLRAQDPNISPDGKWVTFTLTESETTGVAVASLQVQNGHYSLGEVKKIYFPARYDRATTPKFSRDGTKIVFSLHRNGRNSEELMEVDPHTGQTSVLVENGRYNRFPAFSPSGELYFVSDLTGVENLYRFRPGQRPELVTNILSGISFPEFGPDGKLYASVFSFQGWNLGQLLPTEKPVQLEAVTVEAPPSPVSDQNSEPHEPRTPYPIQDYSIYPSILPRHWAPLLFLENSGVYAGAQLLGFDAVDRHGYLLKAMYDSEAKQLDWLASYSNRTLGPTLSLTAEQTTTDNLQIASELRFIRKHRLTVALSQPVLFTYSTLTPFLSMKAERDYIFKSPGNAGNSDDLIYRGPFVPYVDGGMQFTNTRSSRLAITPEEGRFSQLALRHYFQSNSPSWKLLASNTEFFRLWDHHVLVPSLAGTITSRTSPVSASANATVKGLQNQILNSFNANDLDQLTLRGYPNQAFYAKAAAVGSMEYRFPIWHVFRGVGTNPLFFKTITGFGFAETAFFPDQEPGYAFLPAVGGGVRFNSEVFLHVPLTLSTEYHLGLQSNAGGKGEFVLQIAAAGLSF